MGKSGQYLREHSSIQWHHKNLARGQVFVPQTYELEDIFDQLCCEESRFKMCVILVTIDVIKVSYYPLFYKFNWNSPALNSTI